MKRYRKLQKSDIVFQTMAFLLTVMICLPFIWLFLSSLKTNIEYYSQPSPLFPSEPQWNRYEYVFVDLQFWRYMINSIVLAVVCVVLNVISSSFVAYGFARFRFRGKKVVFLVLLMTMFLPAQVSSIPQFLMFNEYGWIDTYLPIITPQLFGASANILLVSQFMRGIPREMDEAARIDGANYFVVWWRVIIPQTVSVLIVVAISAFLGSWKDSMGPLIYLRSEELYTVPVALMFFQAPDQDSYLLLLTGVVISIIPTLIMYVFMQKWLDKGIYVAELK
ncbi:MAG: carbohydrate ABC transporter permease [Clostridia bacterium]|nr:carbohydrate ABC transporter permease [Clostridia bacterium]